MFRPGSVPPQKGEASNGPPDEFVWSGAGDVDANRSSAASVAGMQSNTAVPIGPSRYLEFVQQLNQRRWSHFEASAMLRPATKQGSRSSRFAFQLPHGPCPVLDVISANDLAVADFVDIERHDAERPALRINAHERIERFASCFTANNDPVS